MHFNSRTSSAFCHAALIVIVLLTGTISPGSPAAQRGPGRAVRLGFHTRRGDSRYFSFGSDHPTNKSRTAEERMNTQAPASFYDVLRKTLKKRKTNIEEICPASDSV